jgi:hypothetical protein
VERQRHSAKGATDKLNPVTSELDIRQEMDSMSTDNRKPENNASMVQTILRLLLGVTLFLAGLGHLSWLQVEFQAQVPLWLPMDPDLVVVVSGIVEIGLVLQRDFTFPTELNVAYDERDKLPRGDVGNN